MANGMEATIMGLGFKVMGDCGPCSGYVGVVFGAVFCIVRACCFTMRCRVILGVLVLSFQPWAIFGDRYACCRQDGGLSVESQARSLKRL